MTLTCSELVNLRRQYFILWNSPQRSQVSKVSGPFQMTRLFSSLIAGTFYYTRTPHRLKERLMAPWNGWEMWEVSSTGYTMSLSTLWHPLHHFRLKISFWHRFSDLRIQKSTLSHRKLNPAYNAPSRGVIIESCLTMPRKGCRNS